MTYITRSLKLLVVPERRFALPSTQLPLLFSLLFSFAALSAQELPEVGAPRVLRLVDFQGRPLLGSFSEVAWETRGDGLFFTLENQGTKNIWRAFPDPQDHSRFPSWKALPVTDFTSSKFASNPVPLPGDKSLICVSNVNSKNTQIYRYDLRNPSFTPIAHDETNQNDPSLSPDGRLIAFTQEKGKNSSILGVGANGGQSFLLSSQARGPAWFGQNQLVFESLASGSRGLYTRDLNASQARLLIAGGGEVGAYPMLQNGNNSAGLFFSARPNASSPTRLYLLAPDGSGLRALSGTEGARRPTVSRNGRFLAYDAPLLSDEFSSNSDKPIRSLWVVPLTTSQQNKTLAQESRWVKSPIAEVPRNSVISNADISLTPREVTPRVSPNTTRKPTILLAELKSVSALRGAVYSPAEVDQARGSFIVRGSIKAEAGLTVKLEAGEGQNPISWMNVPVSQTAITNDTIAIWTPPYPSGNWTLRLTVFSRGGAAQNQLNVQLPLSGMSPSDNPPLIASTPRSPIRSVAQVPKESMPVLPLPPPAPIPRLPSYPRPAASPAPRPEPVPTPTQRPVPPPYVPTPRPAPTPVVPRPTPKPLPAPQTPEYAPPTSFVANFNVSGTLARVAANQTFKVTFWGHNTGTANWQTGGTGADRVRVVARWVDFSTGTRRKWNFFWLKAPVTPGGRTKFEFDMSPPSRPGRYKLIYGLVRVPANGEYSPPPYGSPQEAWPGEFGAIAFAVDVLPPVEGVAEEEPQIQ